MNRERGARREWAALTANPCEESARGASSPVGVEDRELVRERDVLAEGVRDAHVAARCELVPGDLQQPAREPVGDHGAQRKHYRLSRVKREHLCRAGGELYV